MEHIESDLKSLIDNVDGLDIDEEHMIIIMYNILCGMNFIHTSNIIHRDIKPANILLSHDCDVKICDFGLARSLPPPIFDMNKYIKTTFDDNSW